jgi:hypothetical protein
VVWRIENRRRDSKRGTAQGLWRYRTDRVSFKEQGEVVVGGLTSEHGRWLAGAQSVGLVQRSFSLSEARRVSVGDRAKAKVSLGSTAVFSDEKRTVVGVFLVRNADGEVVGVQSWRRNKLFDSLRARAWQPLNR